MSVVGVILRFLLGGTAVAATFVIGRKLGGRIGGIFAAFPAVYASAIISTSAGLPRVEASMRALAITRGAMVGMIVNVACAVATGILVARWGWRRGLAVSLTGWLVLATAVFVGGAALGWL